MRGYEKAINWFHSLDESASISGYSYFELIEGCKNSRDLQKLEKFVSVFEILWLNEREIQNALLIFKKTKFKNGMGFIDCLIGQTSLRYKKTLYTFNVKHYKGFSGIKISKPYEK
ncbi:PIN domain protein [Leptospira borgpetersenii serovar Hardjo-bovis str. Sponselee]|uniref:PIN domain protein n=1 Tax=Leptospira borgpetersenii serovar Hardjo-bovis str. Sponselee TaxID=1303729 RepID=M6C2B8_LEPBO|nr:PIN domain protein [Leptospira borgpetersenii serovar Hardjo-bovis str. Sponselee]